MQNVPLLIYIDLFCGAGGVTTGVVKAKFNGKGIAKVIACINHDPVAIESHAANHKKTLHFTEDIRTLNLFQLNRLVEYYRNKYPDCKIVLWASLECTNFSKAKGGQPRNADSRTLAEHLYRYIEVLNPDYVDIENVEEFLSWGPLDENGKPISKKNGRDYRKWVEHIESLGYRYDYRILNAADFGAYTSRKRYFAQFAKGDLPICWPEATHSKTASSGMFGSLLKWKPVKDVLDFSDEGKSIFSRLKDLVENTLARIYAGLVMYVAEGDDSFIQQRNSGEAKSKVVSIERPARTITGTGGNMDIVNVKKGFLIKYYSGRPEGKVSSIESPSGTLRTSDTMGLIQTEFLLKYNSVNKETGKHVPPSVNDPSPAVTCQGRLGLIQTKFLAKYYGEGGGQLQSVDSPASTLTTKDRISLIQPRFWLDKSFGSKYNHASIEGPAGAILTNDHHSLMEARAILNSKEDLPSFIKISEDGEIVIEIYETDSPYTVKIKEFMAAYSIIDIKMRMLKVLELKLIQGFPKNYILKGNKSHQKKLIGNAVETNMAKSITLAKFEGLLKYNQVKAA